MVGVLLLSLSCKTSHTSSSDNRKSLSTDSEPSALWTVISASKIDFEFRRNQPKPLKYQLYTLDTMAMRRRLLDLPKEGSAKSLSQQDTLSLPLEGQGLVSFKVRNSPVMAPELAAQFPEIQTFSGAAILNPAWHLKCEHTPRGFTAQIIAPDQTYFIEPVTGFNQSVYITFRKSDLQQPPDKTFDELPER